MRFGFFRHKGGVLPITGLCVVMGLGILALGIDLGHLFLVKNELQRDADAAALAGALRLMTPAAGITRPVSTSPDCFRAQTAAQAVATSNTADAEPLPSANLDVRLGTYDMATRTFTDTNCANPATVSTPSPPKGSAWSTKKAASHSAPFPYCAPRLHGRRAPDRSGRKGDLQTPLSIGIAARQRSR